LPNAFVADARLRLSGFALCLRTLRFAVNWLRRLPDLHSIHGLSWTFLSILLHQSRPTAPHHAWWQVVWSYWCLPALIQRHCFHRCYLWLLAVLYATLCLVDSIELPNRPWRSTHAGFLLQARLSCSHEIHTRQHVLLARRSRNKLFQVPEVGAESAGSHPLIGQAANIGLPCVVRIWRWYWVWHAFTPWRH